MKLLFSRLPHESSCYTVVLLPALVLCRIDKKLELGLLWLNWKLVLVHGKGELWSV